MLKQFRNDERGVAMVLFALLATVLIPLSGGVVDYAGALTARNRMAGAADAAALAIAGRSAASKKPDETAEQYAKRVKDHAKRIALSFSLAHYPPDARHGVTISEPVIEFVGDEVTVKISGFFHTTFLPVIGIKKLPFSITAKAVQSSQKLDIVLVLDNTGSMSGARLAALKLAAKKMRELLLDDPDGRSVQIGLVPYSTSVNVGKDRIYNLSQNQWLDVAGTSNLNRDDIRLSDNESLFDLHVGMPDSDWGGCVRARTHLISDPPDVDDPRHDVEDTDQTVEPWVALFAPDGRVRPRRRSNRKDKKLANAEAWEALADKAIVETVEEWVNLYHGRVKKDGRNRTGLTDEDLQDFKTRKVSIEVMSDEELRVEFANERRRNNDYLPGYDHPHPRSGTTYKNSKSKPPVRDIDPTIRFDRIPSPNRGCVAAPILPLTSDPISVDNAIDEMKADGNTVIPVGLAWGWRVISPRAPITEAQPNVSGESKVDRAIVLLTDGANTAGGFYTAYGRGNSRPNGDELIKRTLSLCASIKADKIKLYTINFANRPADRKLLEDCASTTCKGREQCSYDSDVASIEGVFETIAKDVQKQRLTQ